MIDDKKTEEAAKHYAEENSMSIEDPMGNIYDCIEELSDAYKAGAKWMQEEFLKNLWHPAGEEPKFGKGRLLVLINGSVSILNVGFVLDQLRNLHNVYGIKAWLYLDDLLPKQEGGEKK